MKLQLTDKAKKLWVKCPQRILDREAAEKRLIDYRNLVESQIEK